MYIEEILLENFKSFGRTTRIPFYEDFTTISGPNGSGKSNIIDAILFALGLARTRGMRAQKLTDLIYNPAHEENRGSEGAREAAVEVVLDNGDRTVSASQIASAIGTESVEEVDQVRIKRRVKQTEDNYYSYYYLNGRSVNLSDIQELLAAAGVTPEGYNVVMQGDVTGIIQMTAHERREIIDEIAGVAEFDRKKEDAFEELEQVREHISEAELRIEEKEQRLDQLEDERETALEYQGLREEKAEYEAYRDLAELEERRQELAATRADIEDRETELAELQETLAEREETVTRLTEDLEDLEAEIERTGEEEQLALKREMEEIRGEISGLEDRIESATERIEEATETRRQAFVKIDRKQEEIGELEDEIREIKVEKASLTGEKQDLQADVESIEAEIDAVDTAYDDLRDDLEAAKSTLEDSKAARNDLQREKDRLLDEARRRSSELETAKADLDAAESRLDELADRLTDLERELEKAERNREQIEGVIDDLEAEKSERRSDLERVESDLQAAQEEYAQLEARADQSGDSSFGRAVTTIRNADLQGVYGPIAELGSVDREYAEACETAAGGRMAHVVVADDGVGERCIEYLKSRNAGRATFLPLTEMEDRHLPDPPQDPGVIDFAFNLVDFDSRYAPAFSYVLGDTLVVEDMATAREFMGEYRLVTLEGDLVEKSGAMTGGSSAGSRYSFEATGKGQLERVAERIESLEDERASIQADIEDLEEQLDRAREKRADAVEDIREIEAEIDRTERSREETESEIEELEARIADLETERESVRDEMDDLDEEIEATEAEIEETEAEIEELEAELAESKIPELTAEKEELEAEIEDIEDRIGDIDGELNSLNLEKEYAESTIEDLQDEVESAQNTKAQQEERIEELEAEIEDRRDALEEKEAAIAELEDELADLKAEREDVREELAAARDRRDEVKNEVENRRNRIRSLEKSAERLESEIEELESSIEDTDTEAVPDLETIEENVRRLEREMARLEPVNMKAIEEYDGVESTLETMVERRDELEEERAAIEDRIDRYDRLKRENFMDAYESIDEQFQQIFERLSDGTGELSLENPEEPFDGGLTMQAQPGDKPVQRLDAMSGGEKSLTALAFIFAIQRYNPAPFYALDEIDAFLDAANAERVGEMVDELASEAQFVVVSHRSAMLERSERAIGVTMQENNVSTVTGIDLADREEGVADD
ncbi:MAG: chromosome segregation protein SMC [Halodesulfurarchaeum sp.]